MQTLQLLLWLAFAIVFYSFAGYGILLWLLVKMKSLFISKKLPSNAYYPEVTLVVPAYNEAAILNEKVKNTRELEYPSGKLKIMFITDGSTDNSRELLAKYTDVQTLHVHRRAGKTAAENRAMHFVSTPVVIFSDANTMLNKEAVKNIVRHFADAQVGCVSGEKRVLMQNADVASAAGEGMYWKYESFLKKLDSQLYSAVGAAGELVAFRTKLFDAMPEDTILDDFYQSMCIAAKGYKIVYEPEAYAVETAAASVGEELKRKIRICAGGWQSIQRLAPKLSFTKSPLLYFQYVSHRVLRWTVNPFLLVLMFVANIPLLFTTSHLYMLTFIMQVWFYAAAFAGYVLEQKKIKVKALFLPYYFCVMNYSVVVGLMRFLKKSQSAVWEKNVRLETERKMAA